ncbi:MAG TPA: hypothetical protein PKE31_06255 [Pseudomonadota bacterium]|jgi:hypothetical protein|nr:hypothetical protein [Pseudomonadota bacterium]
MNMRTSAVLRRAVLGTSAFGLCLFAALGCEQPPDNSPAIRITAPNAGDILPAGKPIQVLFEISGTDSSAGCETGYAFKLNGSDTKECGRGQVRAYIDGVNYVARAFAVPSSSQPWEIPDKTVVSSVDKYLAAGSKRLVFKLFYNDSPGTPVSPQRSVEMNVTLQ